MKIQLLRQPANHTTRNSTSVSLLHLHCAAMGNEVSACFACSCLLVLSLSVAQHIFSYDRHTSSPMNTQPSLMQ
jgi:hypothetical protein